MDPSSIWTNLIKRLGSRLSGLWALGEPPSPDDQMDAIVLEERILYSATPFLIAFDGDVAGNDPSIVSDPEIQETLAALDNYFESLRVASNVDAGASSSVSPDTVQELAPSSEPAVQEPTPTSQSSSGSDVARREVAFVDATLEELDQLILSLQSEVHDGTELEIVRIDSQSDGILTIGNYLASSAYDFDAVHIVTHGNAEGFQLGSSWMNQATLVERFDTLQQWTEGLADDADLLIYGCSVASTSDGQAWLNQLGNQLQVDVAASIDLTGHSSLGGDWDLEFVQGEITTNVAFSDEFQQTWNSVLATYTVSNTSDSGAGSLRQAITDANNNAGADTIQFSIGSGSQVISLSTALPSITGQVTLDGWTQSGFSGTPLIIIDANGLIGDGIVLTSTADNSIIRGLVIRDFTGDGIQIDSGSSGNTIEGNYIGSFGAGGTNLGSTESNTALGINILGNNNTIGGTTATSRNVIGGNQSHGIRITGAGASSNVVLGNYIGTDATGLVDVGNSLNGIYIDSSATNNTIGGLTAASRNIIAGNDNAGIAVDHAGTTGNLIVGNYIGLGANGTTSLGNTHNGINFNTSGANTVGSTDVNGRNIIGSNAIHGIGVDNSTGVTILGNYIGTDVSGTLARGNAGDGVRVLGTSSGTLIGGTASGAGNLIANNTGDGILVSSSSSTAASILQNTIYSNGEEGIDLGADNGLTFNDVADSDTGSNNLINYPILRTATTSGTSSIITGNVRGPARHSVSSSFERLTGKGMPQDTERLAFSWAPRR